MNPSAGQNRVRDRSPHTPAPDGAVQPRWCTDHNVAAVFDIDCFRCPEDNAVIGPPLR